MLDRHTPQARIQTLVRERRIRFEVTPELENSLKKHGATDALINELKQASERKAAAGRGNAGGRAGAGPPAQADRPSTTARLTVTAPRPGEVFRGDPATIPVSLQLDGGQVVPATSLRLVPNEGHIHLSLDGSLIAMTGLVGDVAAAPGPHTLSAEFVAIDHGPFQPRVIATVTFTAVR